VMPALTLAVLLSIDTLKTCIVLDAITRTRHNSNRELVGQGLGNLASVFLGGVPGSGQMGATLVNVSSGGTTRRSGVMEGVLALIAFLLLAKFVAWVPIATLAGILIVVGVRMFDRNSLHLLRSRSTILDFMVIAAVVLVAETVSLIAASAVGVGLAIMLFLREQVGGNVVLRKTYGNQMFSKKVRLQDEMDILQKRGDCSVIFELQGSLFFGTTDQLLTALEPELKTRTYILLDMRRVQLALEFFMGDGGSEPPPAHHRAGVVWRILESALEVRGRLRERRSGAKSAGGEKQRSECSLEFSSRSHLKSSIRSHGSVASGVAGCWTAISALTGSKPSALTVM
jgi:sulfate permease, SulP family